MKKDEYFELSEGLLDDILAVINAFKKTHKIADPEFQLKVIAGALAVASRGVFMDYSVDNESLKGNLEKFFNAVRIAL